MKKVLSLLSIALLMFVMAVPAFAADSPEKNETNFEIVKKEEGLTIEATEDSFDSDTVVYIEPITDEATGSTVFAIVKKALKTLVNKFQSFDVYALKNNVKVQPNGTVRGVFAIPEGYDASKVVVYYIDDNGKAELIPSTVSEDGKTVTAILPHFSTYAVAESASGTQNNSGTSPKTGNTALAVAAVITAGAFVALVYSKKRIAE